jgi:hypothetical protein
MSNPQAVQSLEQLAQVIIERRMVTPAIFLLELSKPLIGCARELYGATEGLQRVVFGPDNFSALKELLSSVDRVEDLIVLLEQGRAGANSTGVASSVAERS